MLPLVDLKIISKCFSKNKQRTIFRPYTPMVFVYKQRVLFDFKYTPYMQTTRTIVHKKLIALGYMYSCQTCSQAFWTPQQQKKSVFQNTVLPLYHLSYFKVARGRSNSKVRLLTKHLHSRQSCLCVQWHENVFP